MEQREKGLQHVPDLTATHDPDADQALGATAFHAIATMPKDKQLAHYFRGFPAAVYSATLKAEQDGRDLQRTIHSLQLSWPLLVNSLARIAEYSTTDHDNRN